MAEIAIPTSTQQNSLFLVMPRLLLPPLLPYKASRPGRECTAKHSGDTLREVGSLSDQDEVEDSSEGCLEP